MEDLSGRQFGQYRIIEPLGEGGMAAVFKAYQPSVDRYVALKVLPQQFAKDPTFISRFEQESRILAKLQHPHILPVFDHGEAEGYTYIVMPMVDSGDLAEYIADHPLTAVEISRIISQVGDALDFAHSLDVVHRDIKPGNILIDARGNCLLTDFGIAKMVTGNAQLTATGGILGTPAYMSPEQGMGESLDGRSDIYSLGVVLYEMATGRVPFKAETPLAVMMKHLTDPLPSPRSIKPEMSEALERVILKSMAKQPADRFQTAGEMVKAAQSALQIEAAAQTGAVATQVSAASVSASAKASAASSPETSVQKRRAAASSAMPKWVWGVIGAALLVVVLGGVAFLRRSSSSANNPATAVISVSPTDTAAGIALPASPPTNTPVSTNTPVPTNTPVSSNTPAPALEASATQAPAATPAPSTLNSPFSLPESVEKFTQAAKGKQINYQTNLSLPEIVDFYRAEFAAQGLVEREIATIIQESVISLVFDGLPDGKSVVLQGVDLGYSSATDMRNVNIRTE